VGGSHVLRTDRELCPVLNGLGLGRYGVGTLSLRESIHDFFCMRIELNKLIIDTSSVPAKCASNRTGHRQKLQLNKENVARYQLDETLVVHAVRAVTTRLQTRTVMRTANLDWFCL